MEKARIFISYKRKNKDQVFSIVEKIETQLGVKCWIDLDGLESSTQFASKICNAIDMAEVVLFMHSSVHLDIDFEEDWTIDELNYAHTIKKRVVLVKLDDAPLKNVFLMKYGAKNNIDSRDETQFQKLLKDLRTWLNLSTQQQRNDITAQYSNLCNIYIDTLVKGKTNTPEIKEQVESLAIKGITEAEYALGFGEYYPHSINIKPNGDNYRKAEKWLEKAAQKGHVKAQTTLAKMYYWTKETDKSIRWAKSASKQNNLDAAQILAWCYRRKEDKNNYMDAIRKAAELQKTLKDKTIHSPAMEYGKILLENRNFKDAIQWFNIAIDLANNLGIKSEAIYHIANSLYQKGDKLQALKWLEKTGNTNLAHDNLITELSNKIKSEIVPLAKLFMK